MEESTTVMKRLDGQMNTRGIAFRGLDDLCRFAELICKSTFVPQAMQGKAGDVVAAIAYGLELGLTPMAALQNIAVINGKPSVFGDMQLALVLSDPNCEYVHERPPDEIKTTLEGRCEAKRKGHEPIVRTFSLDDAKHAGLLDKVGPWKSYSHRMLQMRARSWCLRDAFPDTLKGLYAREEAQDIEPIDVTPRESMTTEPPVDQPKRPTREDLASLSSLRHTCDELQADHAKLHPEYDYTPSDAYIREKLNLPEGTKLTQKLLIERMTIDQYREAQAYFNGIIKMLDEREEQVPDFGGDADRTTGDAPHAADGQEASAPLEARADDGWYASPAQLAHLEDLAQKVGDDAVADVQDLFDHHPDGLTIAVYDIVMARLKARLAT